MENNLVEPGGVIVCSLESLWDGPLQMLIQFCIHWVTLLSLMQDVWHHLTLKQMVGPHIIHAILWRPLCWIFDCEMHTFIHNEGIVLGSGEAPHVLGSGLVPNKACRVWKQYVINATMLLVACLLFLG